MRAAVICATVFAALLLAPAFAAAPEVGARAPEFDLKDQFGKAWKLADLGGAVTILVAADPDSGRAMGPWVDALKNRYSGKARILGLLDLHTVPGIGRGIARSRIKRETKDPMMLDFGGIVSRAYGVSSKHPTVVVIDKTLTVRAAVTAAYDKEQFETITSAVDKALGITERTACASGKA
jgi:hypothetical protein